MTDEAGGASLSNAGGVATILFDRVGARNAMSQATWHALPGLIARAEGEADVGVIVIRGAGGHFGAGNDIAELGRLRNDALACQSYGRDMADAMISVERATKPVIAAIEGNCFGASVALALAADFRVAADDARFAITPAKLGALYLRSDLHRLVATIGQGQARRMIYTACVVEATEAAAIGLVDQMVASDAFEEAIGSIAKSVLRGSAFTIRRSKAMLRGVGRGDAPNEDVESLSWFVDAMRGDDFAEGYAAFMDKRTPTFARP
jgi:enoyl-CoA hydratase/carnithine racemase